MSFILKKIKNGKKEVYKTGEMMKAFSFDLSGEFAFFKKNDANDFLYISYNFIHKPVVLGMCGAVSGLPGYAQSVNNSFPGYYQRLKNVKLAIKPHYYKPLKKVITGFNNSTGLASKSSENKGQTWQVKEQILVGEPDIRYTIFILDDETVEPQLMVLLKDRLKKGETEYPLYFGKNEFFAVSDNYREYEAVPIQEKTAFFSSLVRKGEDEKESAVSFKEITFDDFDPFAASVHEGHTVYEYLPYDLDHNGFYIKDLFVFTQRLLEIKRNPDFFTLTPLEGGPQTNVQFI
jgi:CRISPR-associated protein Cas5h